MLSDGGDRWLTLVVKGSRGEVIGFCSVATPSRDEDASPRTAEIGALYVDPDHWHRGAGGALLAAALTELREQGWRDLVLWVLPENRPALAFYERFGFVIEPGIEKREERSGHRVIRLRVGVDEPIQLVPYDPSWPGKFAKEQAALDEAIGSWATGDIHHVGSTAVPGLDAKPIIDILVGVEGLEASWACFEPLAALGYLYAPYRADEMHWFCKPHPSRRTGLARCIPASRWTAGVMDEHPPQLSPGESSDGVGVTLDIRDELVERIAQRAAELVARHRDETAGDGWLRGADKIAAYIDAPRSRVYGLVAARGIPVHHDGSALIARRSELDAWLQAGGGTRL